MDASATWLNRTAFEARLMLPSLICLRTLALMACIFSVASFHLLVWAPQDALFAASPPLWIQRFALRREFFVSESTIQLKALSLAKAVRTA